MLGLNDYYDQHLSHDELYSIVEDQYVAESDLVKSVLWHAIARGLINTSYELAVALETISDLNDWPEGEGYGSSDRSADLRSIEDNVKSTREYFKAETELCVLNNLTERPKVADVHKYMAMNRKLKEGLTEGGQ